MSGRNSSGYPKNTEQGSSLIPLIRRARGWRLYGMDGTRYLDLCVDGGISLMGRKPPAQGRLAKACLDMGLVSGLPTFWRARFEKALHEWKPEYGYARFYENNAEAALAVLQAGVMQEPDVLSAVSGGVRNLSGTVGALARTIRREVSFGEFLPGNARDSFLGGRIALGNLPLPALWSFGIVLFKDADFLEVLPREQAIPAIKLALAARSLADLTSFKTVYNEKHWSGIDPFIAGLFTRRGPWLFPSYPEDRHEEVFQACLDRRILISEDYLQPSCVPGEYDKGELFPLKSVAEAYGASVSKTVEPGL